MISVKKNAVFGVPKTRVIAMTPDEWSQIPDNPRQRDTERRAAKAEDGYLAVFKPPHACVAAAAIRGKIVCKVDGHVRCHLWSNNRIERPSDLLVTVFDCDNIEEAKELYVLYDNVNAVETAADRTFGGLREFGINNLTSPVLRRCRFSTALRLAEGWNYGCDPYAMVGRWTRELVIVDSWQLSKAHTATLALYLMLACKNWKREDDIAKVRSFAQGVTNGTGVKEGRLRDGVECFNDMIAERKNKSRMTGFDNLFDIAATGLSCFDAWAEGKLIERCRPSGEELKKLIAFCKEQHK